MAMCILNHSVRRRGEKNPMSSLARSELQVMVRRKPQCSPDLHIRAHDNTQKERTGKEKGRLGAEVERKKVKGWRDKKAGSWHHTPTRHPESPHAQWCSSCFLGALRLGLSLRVNSESDPTLGCSFAHHSPPSQLRSEQHRQHGGSLSISCLVTSLEETTCLPGLSNAYPAIRH